MTETDDARSFVLEVPDDLAETFRYRPGQFCSFRIHVDRDGDGETDEHARCYSMSSAPEIDDRLTVTVKRVPGGIVSNWLIDHVSVGDHLEVTRPAGNFCVREGDRPVIGFCGGSGVTPVISIAKSVLAGTGRPVSVLYANRDADSVIFDRTWAGMADEHGDRLEVRHHHDSAGGYLTADAITGFVAGRLAADFYICGPGPFMDLVETTLLGVGVAPDSILIERFATPPPESIAPGASTALDEPNVAMAGQSDGEASDSGEAAADTTSEVVLILKGKKHRLDYRAGDTVLGTARRHNVAAPYSCEAGNCATCMALIIEGTATMRVNDALTDDEVEEGWVLTCQAEPTSPTITIEYEPL